MLTIIVCSFPVLMIEIRGKLKSQQRNKHAEKLHKHAHTAILPTDTFKLQISAQKRRLASVLVNIPVPAQRSTF